MVSWKARYNHTKITPNKIKLGLFVRLNSTSNKSDWDIDTDDKQCDYKITTYTDTDLVKQIILKKRYGLDTNEWWMSLDFLIKHFEVA